MHNNSRIAALGGILGALCMICLYLAVYLPTSRLFFYGISSLFCSIMIIEFGIKAAWIFVFSTMLLSFIIIPDKIRIIPYISFFGIYGIIKYYIENIKYRTIRIALKGIFFVISVCLTAVIAKELFFADMESKLPVYVIGLIGLAVFYVYDYAYSKFIVYYKLHISKSYR
jgi:hypothetical protein